MSAPDPAKTTTERKSFGKPVLGVLLVAVAAGAVIVGVIRESLDSRAADAAVGAAARSDVVTVYYFHGETRCDTCLAIETATERVVRERFADEIAAGMLRYEAVNFEAPADRHFRDDYDLAFGSVLVQGVGDGHPWENLADVWTLIHDEPAALEAYLVEHITLMLAGNG